MFSWLMTWCNMCLQVTNPPIDPIREAIVTSLKCMIGPEGDFSTTKEAQVRGNSEFNCDDTWMRRRIPNSERFNLGFSSILQNISIYLTMFRLRASAMKFPPQHGINLLGMFVKLILIDHLVLPVWLGRQVCKNRARLIRASTELTMALFVLHSIHKPRLFHRDTNFAYIRAFTCCLQHECTRNSCCKQQVRVQMCKLYLYIQFWLCTISDQSVAAGEIFPQVHRLSLETPLLDIPEMEAIKRTSHRDWKTYTVDATFPVAEGRAGLSKALERLREEADAAVKEGYSLVVLSDRK